MELTNPLYKNMGAHVVDTIFTIDKGRIKVLLIKRNNEPYRGSWALVSGAMYNNELIETAALRELKEKTNISDIELTFIGVDDDIDSSPLLRMFAFIHIGLVDFQNIKFFKETEKTMDADWFDINDIPELAYDHNKILDYAIEKLKTMNNSTNI